MEEKRKVAQEAPKKLSYEDLQKAAADLSVQYQKLLAEYQRCQEALQRRDFDMTSFFLSMLFKVMDNAELYDGKFVEWCKTNIQSALTTFVDNMAKEAEAEATQAKKDEAE